MSKFISAFLLLMSSFVFAGPGRTTYQARIVKPDGYPLESVSVNFRFTILDPSASCVLYVEDYAAVDMTGTRGLISFALGMGTKTYPTSGTVTFEKAFDNSVPSLACQSPGVYNPMPDHTRSIVMQFNDGNGWQTLPAMAINAVPYSMFASKSQNSEKLNGKADTNFVEYATLASLNCQANEAIKFNGVSFSCIAVGSGGGGGITSVTTSGTVLTTGGTASAPVISIQVATGAQSGYLSSGDWTTFNNKQNATSGAIIATLGYTPADNAALSTLSSTVSSLQSATATSTTLLTNNVNSVSSTVASLQLAMATSLSAITSSQWATSGSSISYSGNNVGVGTSSPISGEGKSIHLYNDLNDGTIYSNTALVVQSLNRNAYVNVTATASGGLSGIQFRNTDGANTIGQGGITYNHTSKSMTFTTSQGVRMSLDGLGNLGLGVTSATARLHIAAGTSTNAPLKFNPGTLLSSPQSGTVEYDGTDYYFTDSTNARRSLSSIAAGGVTSSAISSALGYTPANSATVTSLSSTVASSFTTITNNVNTVSSAVSSLQVSTAASFAAVTASQWITSGTTISYSTGNVGIGTSAPAAMLHVASDNAAKAIITAKGTASQSGPWLRLTDSTNAVLATISPNSGMPQFRLGPSTNEIVLTGAYGGAFEMPTGTLLSSTNNLSIATTGAAGSKVMAAYSTGSGFNSAWEIANVGSGLGNLLLMKSGGSVGIGTTNPGQALDVSGSVRATKFLAADGAFNSPSIAFANSPNTGFFNSAGTLGISVGGALKGFWYSGSLAFNAGGAGPQIYFTGGDAANPSYAFNSDSDTGMFNPNASGGSNELGFSTAGVERVRILSTGNVGVGTSAPTVKLHVEDSVDGAGVAYFGLKNGTDLTGLNIYNYGPSYATTYMQKTTMLYASSGGATDNLQLTAASASGTIRFHTTGWSTSSTERMRISPNGYVGIGTINPDTYGRLTVYGSEPTSYTAASLNSSQYNKGVTGLIYNNDTTVGSYAGMRFVNRVSSADIWSILSISNGPTDSDLIFGSVAGEALRMKHNGYVGVGTSSPTRRLSVSHSNNTAYVSTGSAPSGATSLLLENPSTTNASTFIDLSVNGGNGVGHAYIGAVYGPWALANTPANIVFGASKSIYTEQMALEGTLGTLAIGYPASTLISSPSNSLVVSNSVGIGTKTPGKNLTVVGSVAVGSGANSAIRGTDYLTIATASTTARRTAIQFAQNTTGTFEIGVDVSMSNNQNFYIYDNVVSLPRFQIDSSGNIGVGATPSVYKLDVNGEIVARNGYGNILYIGGDSGGNDLEIGTTQAGNNVLSFYNRGAGSYMDIVAKNITYTGSLSPSDRRLKKDIQILDHSLDKMLQVEGVSYYWKDPKKYSNGLQYGVIAQQVETIFPNLVDTNAEGMKKVNYIGFLSPLIESLKEFYSRWMNDSEKLHRDIASLDERKADKAEIEKLKNENAELRAYLCSKDPAAPICK